VNGSDYSNQQPFANSTTVMGTSANYFNNTTSDNFFNDQFNNHQTDPYYSAAQQQPSQNYNPNHQNVNNNPQSLYQPQQTSKH
jgi:hypothetical protein